MENKIKTTPRTDAEAVFPSCNDSSDTSHPQGTHVDADFARALERELAIELERATHYRDQWQRVTSELATERARMDWMEKQGPWESWFQPAKENSLLLRAPIRAAIDAAMKEETK